MEFRARKFHFLGPNRVRALGTAAAAAAAAAATTTTSTTTTSWSHCPWLFVPSDLKALVGEGIGWPIEMAKGDRYKEHVGNGGEFGGVWWYLCKTASLLH